MELGLLPALGSGIGELARTGQATRLIEGYLRPYARAFERVWYCELPARNARGLHRRPGARRVGARPCSARAPARVSVRALDDARSVIAASCGARAVLRVFQVTGVIPALIARARWGTPFVTTYGFWYARLVAARPLAARQARCSSASGSGGPPP